MTPVDAPATPTGVTATAGLDAYNIQKVVRINFGEVAANGSSILSYVVTAQDLTTPGNGGQTVILDSSRNDLATGESGATFVGLIEGDDYKFSVKAINKVGASAASDLSNTVNLGAAPDAPGRPAVAAGKRSAVVYFDEPATHGSAIESYTVTAWGQGGPFVVTGTSSPITVTGLVAGEDYSFDVMATNGFGASDRSAYENARPYGEPDAPTAVTVEPKASRQTVGGINQWSRSAQLNFIAPSANGSAITSYKVTAHDSTDPTIEDQVVVLDSDGWRGTEFEHLTEGHEYVFTVKASNAAGESDASAASDSLTLGGVPDQMAPPTAAAGDGSASVSFAAPDSNGAAITKYTVTASDTQGPDITVDGNSSPVAVSGLTNGHRYTFTVAATNSYGAGDVSQASDGATPVKAPGVPDAPGIRSVTGGDRSAAVSIERPNANGSAITAFQVVSSDLTDPSAESRVVSTDGNASSLVTVGGLTNGHHYTFRVTATNAIGRSQASQPSVDTLVAGGPDAPSELTASGGYRSLSVNFKVPATRGAAIVGYEVSTSNWLGSGTYFVSLSDAACSCDADAGQAAGITLSASRLGISNGSGYSVSVRAVSSAELKGAWAYAAAEALLAGVPEAPYNVSAVAGADSAVVTFNRSIDDGGSAISRFVVTAHDLTDPARGGQTTDRWEEPFKVTGLTQGDSYQFTVHAVNAKGAGAESDASAPVTPAAIPDAPSDVTAEADNGSARVFFTEPSANGLPITAYRLLAHDLSDTEGDDRTADVGASAELQSAGYPIGGLTNGHHYTFRVQAINAVGVGPVSTQSTGFQTPVGKPSVPEFTAEAGYRSATASFTPPSDNGSVITEYTLTARDLANPSAAAIEVVGKSSPMTVPGLTAGRWYSLVLKATNSAGSTESTVNSHLGDVNFGTSDGWWLKSYFGADTRLVVPWGIPGSPSEVSASTTGLGGSTLDSAADVTFTQPTDLSSATGSPVTAYTVTATDVTNPDNGGQSTEIDYDSNYSDYWPRTARVTGLTPGDRYTFTVKARNAAGFGAESDPSARVTAGGVPSKPRLISVVPDGNLVHVNFDPPAVANPAVLRYWLIASKTQGCTVETFDTCEDAHQSLLSGTSKTFRVSATPLVSGEWLDRDTKYYFSVAAQNSVGRGDAEATDSTVVGDYAAELATVATAVDVLNGVHVSFSVLNYPQTPTTKVTIRALDQTDPSNDPVVTTWYPIEGADGSDITTLFFGGLQNGHSYKFAFTPTNSLGDGHTAETEPVTPVGASSAPNDLSVTPGNASASVSFSPPTSLNGNAVINSYTLTAVNMTTGDLGDSVTVYNTNPVVLRG
ncbi:MAG: fibronectin type III domain-containing protein, partial [Actinomycetes bacterium]